MVELHCKKNCQFIAQCEGKIRKFHASSELQNATIEERFTLLETQMEIVNDGIADIEDNVDNLEGQVTVLFGDQVIQDEQILKLEESMYECILSFNLVYGAYMLNSIIINIFSFCTRPNRQDV